MDEKEISVLIQTRGVYKAAMTRVENFVKKYDPKIHSKEDVSVRLEKLIESWNNYSEVQLSLEINDSKTDHSSDIVTVEEQYLSTRVIMQKILNDFQLQDETINRSIKDINTSDIAFNPHCIKLPAISLPSFNGDFSNWVHFKDVFESLVLNNTSLTDIQRFHYLNSSLSNEARDLICNLPMSAENFNVAWDLVYKRYNNPKLIVNKHILNLLNLPSATKESSTNLRKLINHVRGNINAIDALKINVPLHELLLVQMLLSNLDLATKKSWEHKNSGTDPPKLADLLVFLEERCQALTTLQVNDVTPISQCKQDFKQYKKSYLTTQVIKKNCIICKQNHNLFNCSDFLKLSVNQREAIVREHRLCFNCLRPNHTAPKCISKQSCHKCGLRHHTLIHRFKDNANVSVFNKQPTRASTIPQEGSNIHQPTKVTDSPVLLSTSHTSCQGTVSSVLLSTAVVYVLDKRGIQHLCRVLLDSGSQSNFISDKVVRKLGLTSSHACVEISGIGQSTKTTSKVVQCIIKSRLNSSSFNIDCIVLDSITQKLPTIFFEKSEIELPPDIKLADPHFNQPGDIDMLIGAELFFELLCDGKLKLSPSLPILQNTVFGWVISGKVNTNSVSNVTSVCHLSVLDDINKNVQRFWDLEDCSGEKQLTGNDRLCEEMFVSTTVREESGRYVVKIPFQRDISELGESEATAVRRLLAVERRLSTNEALRSEYIRFMSEYERLGHMYEVTPTEDDSSRAYYIPHHAVVKEDSSTTKVRVVFDASCKTSSGISLNNISIVGPTVQSSLIDIVTRFRTYPFVITADIEKMYRQIKIHPSQHSLQRILWRKKSSDPIKTFQLSTVTYGTASAPYLATRVLKQLALDEQHNFPTASETVINDFYVDDLMTGANSIDEAKQLQQDLTKLTQRGGFHLRKWSANHPSILSEVPSEDIVHDCFEIDADTTVKTLGLIWNPKKDTFQFSIKQTKPPEVVTKRTVLSAIGRIFDPLGLIGPVILVAKLIMQHLWTYQLGWDDEVPRELCERWNSFQESLPTLMNLQVPRALLPNRTETLHLEIHGFSDASESAYGACVYLKSTDVNGDIFVKLITSKSRVAPLKRVSLPRLELCGALLLSQLAKNTVEALHLKIDSFTYYTDSTIVLAWIKSPSSHWTTFVANRVSKIQDSTNINSWEHVKSEDNPADYLSRGLLPSEILTSSLYWNGPAFLHSNDKRNCNQISLPDSAELPERRQRVFPSTIIKQPGINMCNYSSYIRLQRVIAYCLRFIHNSRSSRPRSTGPLSVSELQLAEETIIKIVQGESFPKELCALKSGKPLDKQSKLISLNPFIDEREVIRVGGRLQLSDLHPDQIHPIVLPKGHILTELIAKHVHLKTLHSGPQLLLSIIRQNYWPIDGRNLVRRIFHQCTACFKSNPKLQANIMGSLPKSRVQTSIRAFFTTGVDYCGPFYVKILKRRGSTPVKCYIALFICFSTKALHLELVEDLSTGSFIAALHRFIARRGKPKDIYSDNGTNFVGASRELKELADLWKTEEFKNEIPTTLSQDNITWHFQPPKAPHFGGLWESSVKLVKTHLKRVVGNSILTYVHFTTLLTQIEACINSRPLIPLSSDPSDLYPLTPSHFLIGDVLTKNPEPSFIDIPSNRLNHWHQVQQLLQHFWSRWSRDYLNHLQQRRKWTSTSPNISVGDLVIIKEDNLPPLQWRMARVTAVYPGQDNVIRVASLKTASGVLKRPITKLCVLPGFETNDN